MLEMFERRRSTLWPALEGLHYRHVDRDQLVRLFEKVLSPLHSSKHGWRRPNSPRPTA